MAEKETEGGFGTRLVHRLQQQGLSRGQIYKALSLQRLSEDVSRLGVEKGLSESLMLEISKVRNHTSQKTLAETILEHDLSLAWAKELSRLVRLTEKLKDNDKQSKAWDFFFRVGQRIAESGTSRQLLKTIGEFRESLVSEEDPHVEVIETETERERRIVNFSKLKLLPGKGLDVGTANIVSAGRERDGNTVFNIQRNHFLDVRDDSITKKILTKLAINWTTHGNRLYVVGDPAFELANVFEKEVRRPMKDGMISPYEAEALIIVNSLISHLMGGPSIEGEICAFSIPAAPIDYERDNIYHQGVLESLLRRMGYTPKSIIEGQAIVFGELEDEHYSGLGISCGGGMFNVCATYKSIPALAFSTMRGGDWVDQSVSKAVGLTGSQVCAIKESGVDLAHPRGRVEDAIAIYYRNLIQYTIDQIRKRLETADVLPSFDTAVSVVCGGGTSLVGGFIDVFRQELQKSPLPIDVKDIRLARDPLHTVAFGCLNAAQQETVAQFGLHLQESQAPQGPAFSVEILDKMGAPKGARPPLPKAAESTPDQAPELEAEAEEVDAALEALEEEDAEVEAEAEAEAEAESDNSKDQPPSSK